jgi:hypothetical protein
LLVNLLGVYTRTVFRSPFPSASATIDNARGSGGNPGIRIIVARKSQDSRPPLK